MYAPSKIGDKRTFWGFVRIAFVIAAVLLYLDEHTKVTQFQSRYSEYHTHLYFAPQASITIDNPSVPKWPFKSGDTPIAATSRGNVGHQYITDVEVAGQFILAAVPDFKSGKAFEDFVSNPTSFQQIGILAPNPAFGLNPFNYTTYAAKTLDSKEVYGLDHGTLGLGIMGIAHWRDDSGCYSTYYFEYESAIEQGGQTSWAWQTGTRSEQESPISCRK